MALSRQTREKINDHIVWLNWHADKVGTYPIQGQINWLLKAVHGSYVCLSALANDNDVADLRRLGLERTAGGVLLPSARWTK